MSGSGRAEILRLEVHSVSSKSALQRKLRPLKFAKCEIAYRIFVPARGSVTKGAAVQSLKDPRRTLPFVPPPARGLQSGVSETPDARHP